MVYFIFDPGALDGTDEKQKTDILRAARVAKKVAADFQAAAQAREEGRSTQFIEKPRLDAHEHMIVTESALLIRGIGIDQATFAAVAAAKIFLGTKLDYNRTHPDALESDDYKKDPGLAWELIDYFAAMGRVLPPTHPVVDDYYDAALKRFSDWLPDFVKQDSPKI